MRKLSKSEVKKQFRENWRQFVRVVPHMANDKGAKSEAFSSFIDSLHRDGQITDRCAQSITLD